MTRSVAGFVIGALLALPSFGADLRPTKTPADIYTATQRSRGCATS